MNAVIPAPKVLLKAKRDAEQELKMSGKKTLQDKKWDKGPWDKGHWARRK